MFPLFSTWGNILVVACIALSIIHILKNPRPFLKEGLASQNSLIKGPQIFDDFYTNIYDSLVFSGRKNDFEMEILEKHANLEDDSVILDIGSGTGHHVGELVSENFDARGVDSSPSMVNRAKENYPNCKFMVGNVTQSSLFGYSLFSHITCFYFTIYYIKDKSIVFRNIRNWLKHNGIFILHLVDPDKFNPILPPANPLLMLTPQNFVKNRITKSSVIFDDFKYTGNFVHTPEKTAYVEKFENNGKMFRKQEHEFFMEDEKSIVDMVLQAEFKLLEVFDMKPAAGYDHNRLYMFTTD